MIKPEDVLLRDTQLAILNTFEKTLDKELERNRDHFRSEETRKSWLTIKVDGANQLSDEERFLLGRRYRDAGWSDAVYTPDGFRFRL